MYSSLTPPSMLESISEVVDMVDPALMGQPQVRL